MLRSPWRTGQAIKNNFKKYEPFHSWANPPNLEACWTTLFRIKSTNKCRLNNCQRMHWLQNGPTVDIDFRIGSQSADEHELSQSYTGSLPSIFVPREEGRAHASTMTYGSQSWWPMVSQRWWPMVSLKLRTSSFSKLMTYGFSKMMSYSLSIKHLISGFSHFSTTSNHALML